MIDDGLMKCKQEDDVVDVHLHALNIDLTYYIARSKSVLGEPSYQP